MTNFALNTLGFVFALAEKIESFNYRQAAMKAVALAAIVVGVVTYFWTAAQLFWEEHGEEITLRFQQFVDSTEKAIDATFEAGLSFRPVANYWVARLFDTAFYALVD